MLKISSLGRQTYRIYTQAFTKIRRQSTSSVETLANYPYKTLAVSSPSEHVYHVEINRPQKRNAFNKDIWREIGECFSQLREDSHCRVAVLSGRGKLFTSGIDFADFSEIGSITTGEEDIARKCRALLKLIREYRNSFSSLEICPKPVIAAVHGACIGAGVDLISSADIRYCTSDAWFQIKEIDLGLATDIGTLQRFPKSIGSSSVARELCCTGRKFFSDEAEKIGFISRVFSDKDELITNALELASTITKKSPVAVQTTKETLNYARDHSVEEGLEFIAGRNMALLQSEDLMKSAMAVMNKETAKFSDY